MFGGKPRKGKALQINLDSRLLNEVRQVSDVYTIGKELGSGAFGTVKAGVHKQEKTEWALKFVQNNVFRENQAQTEKEVSILASLAHPGIVKLKEVLVTTRFFVIVLELLRGGELFDRIVEKEKYDENDAKAVARELMEILAFLHDRDIVHRDLKPENLLFDGPGDDAKLKLSDFGLADKFTPGSSLTLSCGTPEYVAPEIIKERPYNSKVDIWSAGVIIYILLCGFPPFYGDNDEELFERVCNEDYEFTRPFWDAVSDDAIDLVSKMLTLNPRRRPSAKEVLKHKWFKTQAKAGSLKAAQGELKRYSATRKLRKGVLAIVAANKVRMMLENAPANRNKDAGKQDAARKRK